MVTPQEDKNPWFESHSHAAALAVTFLGFLARLWTASGTFLNPDEALHFRLANQPSLALAYQQSLTAAHPPLLILLLYYWRGLGTSELWLRMPSVLAGAVFCWMFYKWLTQAAGNLAGFVGLLLVAFLPPIILVAAEIRQYSLLLAFLAAALYFLDEAFAKNSAGRMVAFSLCLYLALLFHYSGFLFAGALGIYALIRFFTKRYPAGLAAIWAFGQVVALALAFFLYKTHISKLGAGESRIALQGWMSEFYLRRSYFDPTHDNPLVFLLGHTFGVFQFFFGQLAVGDVIGLVFLVGIVLLLRGRAFPADQSDNRSGDHRTSSRQLAILILLLFAITAAASLAHVYPYGGTRHVAFLIIPGIAGASVAIAWLARERWTRAVAIAAVIVLACAIFGKARQPSMERADQGRANVTAMMKLIAKNVNTSDVIFTDYQSDLVLGHYLCRQRPISFDAAPEGFEAFSCEGHLVVSENYRQGAFQAGRFEDDFRRLARDYALKPGTTVWIVQVWWNAALSQELTKDAAFQNLPVAKFGKNLRIFKMRAEKDGQ